MSRDHPWVLGRLFHAARDLLGWSQKRVAAEAGVSTAVLHALEMGRDPVATQAMLSVLATLERSGVRFLAAADGFGHGVRYAAAGGPDEAGSSPFGPQLVPRSGAPAATGSATVAGQRTKGRLVAAEARTARQRQLVERLVSAGHDVVLATKLLVQMERALGLMRQSDRLSAASRLDNSGDAPVCFADAA